MPHAIEAIPNDTQGVLTLDPHVRRVGYGYVKQDRLLDWGVKNVSSRTPSVPIDRSVMPLLVGLLDRFSPAVVLVPSVQVRRWRRSSLVKSAIDALTVEAVQRGIAVYAFADADVKRRIGQASGMPMPNKDAINAVIVRRFPELAAAVPKARRLWDPERYYTPLFNAVAMYLAWHDPNAD